MCFTLGESSSLQYLILGPNQCLTPFCPVRCKYRGNCQCVPHLRRTVSVVVIPIARQTFLVPGVSFLSALHTHDDLLYSVIPPQPSSVPLVIELLSDGS